LAYLIAHIRFKNWCHVGLKNVHVCIKEADLVTSPADKVWAVNYRSSCIFVMAELASMALYLNITSSASENCRIWDQNACCTWLLSNTEDGLSPLGWGITI
jgi:hypothetical protein